MHLDEEVLHLMRIGAAALWVGKRNTAAVGGGAVALAEEAVMHLKKSFGSSMHLNQNQPEEACT
ncbi:hypothetical protein SESBI_35186 [Sesbania bispinosa]|nr:hypothetical protein SESBI_35186 [Sesbania bispinosa]